MIKQSAQSSQANEQNNQQNNYVTMLTHSKSQAHINLQKLQL